MEEFLFGISDRMISMMSAVERNVFIRNIINKVKGGSIIRFLVLVDRTSFNLHKNRLEIKRNILRIT